MWCSFLFLDLSHIDSERPKTIVKSAHQEVFQSGAAGYFGAAFVFLAHIWRDYVSQ